MTIFISLFQNLNYYDDYAFPGIGTDQPVSGQADGQGVKGLLTGSKVRNLGNGTMLLTVNYYDLDEIGVFHNNLTFSFGYKMSLGFSSEIYTQT